MDAQLVARFQSGERSAFEELVRRHMREAVAFCVRLTGSAEQGEELSQEGFVRAFRSLHRFRGESSFRSWLFQIFVNGHRDARRRASRSRARLETVREEALRAGRPSASPSEAREAGELETAVRARIAELPDRQREVLLLHMDGGLDYGAIAAALGCSYDDVKSNLSLARKKLREGLKAFLEESP